MKGYDVMKQWYEELFVNYGMQYDNECFTHGTVGECDFIEKEIGYDKSLRILDIGCGTGRHTIELTRRGYTVVGVDLSDSQLERARQKASMENLQIDFQKRDARDLPFLHEFDVVVMLCEGGFSLMETDTMNYRILRNAANALKPKGKLIFTTLNALFPLFHSVKDFIDSNKKEGNSTCESISFDLMTFRELSTVRAEDDLGNKKELLCSVRYYTPTEIAWFLETLDFKAIDIFGATLGAFSRNDELKTEDFEMLVVAEK
jgi:2-polyprenyl-3-methyl-5-hydroxy-6-metoxy-1,4-benzoquinol methylase